MRMFLSIKKTLLLIVPIILFIAAVYPASGQDRLEVSAEYYGEIGCSHCDTFESVQLPALQAKTGVSVNLTVYDILSASGYARCKAELESRGHKFTIFPVLIIGNNAYQGNSAIDMNLEEELAYFAAHGTYRPRLPGTEMGVGVGAAEAPGTEVTQDTAAGDPGAGPVIAFIPIFLAGLIDGINPCAFTTLLFFISYLGLRGRTRRKMLLYGLVFAAGVFVSYFFIGLGLFNVLRASLNLNFFRLIMRIIVSAATAVFCVFSVVDYVRIRRGDTSKLSLQLPKAVKDRIHASIRSGTDTVARSGAGSAAMAFGVFVTGLVVAVLELACTGQIYLPTVSYMVQTDASLLGLSSLLLYNFAFILPLLAVLAAVLLGIRHEKITSMFKRRLGFTKLLLAGIFAILAVLVWVF